MFKVLQPIVNLVFRFSALELWASFVSVAVVGWRTILGLIRDKVWNSGGSFSVHHRDGRVVFVPVRVAAVRRAAITPGINLPTAEGDGSVDLSFIKHWESRWPVPVRDASVRRAAVAPGIDLPQAEGNGGVASVAKKNVSGHSGEEDGQLRQHELQ